MDSKKISKIFFIISILCSGIILVFSALQTPTQSRSISIEGILSPGESYVVYNIWGYRTETLDYSVQSDGDMYLFLMNYDQDVEEVLAFLNQESSSVTTIDSDSGKDTNVNVNLESYTNGDRFKIVVCNHNGINWNSESRDFILQGYAIETNGEWYNLRIYIIVLGIISIASSVFVFLNFNKPETTKT